MLNKAHVLASRVRQPNPFPTLFGEVVYYRTYSRMDNGYPEHLSDTLERVVNYSMSLIPKNSLITKEEIEKESEQLYNNLYSLNSFTSGRTMWIADTEAVRRNSAANYNCCFLDIKSPDDFYEMAKLLMSGSGVGFRITMDNVEEFNLNTPPREDVFDLTFKDYEFIGEPSILVDTQVKDINNIRVITVGDSREGWGKAVSEFVHCFTKASEHITHVRVNFDYVRPEGMPLKGFGGFASGYKPLKDFFLDVWLILFKGKSRWSNSWFKNEKGDWEQKLVIVDMDKEQDMFNIYSDEYKFNKFTDINLLDIGNLIGRTVVAGNIRRSAEIALGDTPEFAVSKSSHYWQQYMPWRSQSNNTDVYHNKPENKEVLKLALTRAIVNGYGENGLLNEEAALKRRYNFRGINPCAEILMANKGVCNLTSINMKWFIPLYKKSDKTEFWNKLKEVTQLLMRHSLRITCAEFPSDLKEWNDTQQSDRLTGISITGQANFKNYFGFAEDSAEWLAILRFIHEVQREEAKKYAFKLRIPEPLLTSTVKPEGTLTQLAGASSGVHDEFAPFYLRRIRIGSNHPIAKTLVDMGMKAYPQQGRSLAESTEWIFEFPVQSFATRCAADIPVLEQLERYKILMENYVEHNVSITVYASEEDIDLIVDWLWENWDKYVAISFMPKSAAGKFYMPPYEEITEEQYQQYLENMPNGFNYELYCKHVSDSMQLDDTLDADCVTGACPVR